MTRIISFHSFRGGTGKSNITANAAYMLAQRGNRVGIFDTDIQSPGIHVIFNLLETSSSIIHPKVQVEIQVNYTLLVGITF